ncbi:MAG: transglycosylase SLT domain-containing protein [Desulfobulbus sp.]
MKKIFRFLSPLCIALLCFTLTACSSRTARNGLENDLVSAQEEALTPSEPEENAQEERDAINRLGVWKCGPEEAEALRRAGINPADYDFPITINPQVQYYLNLFQGKQRNYFTHWLARSTAHRPQIEAALQKAGLPKDLFFLPMIESGYNPSAYSPAQACGLWQFMAPTGRDYGLQINKWVDERREPAKATPAAIRYLSRLYRQFGDWHLAVAAYNAGEGRIDDAIKLCRSNDFWEIATSRGIFQETKHYVPKLIAAIIIGRNPEKYGFTDIKYQRPHRYETISVPGNIDLNTLAAVAHTSGKHLRTLNNELRRHQTPPGQRYELRVPIGSAALIAGNMHQLKEVQPETPVVHSTPAKGKHYVMHTVKRGDTVSGLCRKYNISKTALFRANDLKNSTLQCGKRLRIPTSAAAYAAASSGSQSKKVRIAKAATPASSSRSEARSDSTRQQGVKVVVATAAKKKAVAATTTASASATKAASQTSTRKNVVVARAAVPHQGQKVAATAKESAPSKRSAAVEPTKKATVVAAAAKKSSPSNQTWYVVKSGDTLSTIAQKFKTSAKDLRQLNRLSSNTVQTGNKLLVRKG